MADQLQTARRRTDNSRECSCSSTTQLSTLNFSTTLKTLLLDNSTFIEDRRAFRFRCDEISEIELWNRMRTSRGTHFRLLRDANVFRLGEKRAALLRRLRGRRFVSCRRFCPNEFSERRVYFFRRWKNFRDVGFQNYDVRSFGITARVFSPSALREIVFASHSVSF